MRFMTLVAAMTAVALVAANATGLHVLGVKFQCSLTIVFEDAGHFFHDGGEVSNTIGGLAGDGRNGPFEIGVGPSFQNAELAVEVKEQIAEITGRLAETNEVRRIDLIILFVEFNELHLSVDMRSSEIYIFKASLQGSFRNAS